MQLLAPHVGWVLSGDLFWTDDGGARWRDITPAQARGEPSRPGPAAVTIGSVYFLDISTGWVLLSRAREGAPEVHTFELASTADRGASWSVTPVDPHVTASDAPLFAGGSLAFVDGLHGWLCLGIASNSNFSLGLLLETADGGRTWKRADHPRVAGDLRFVTAKDGWLTGGPGNQHLFVTHDGAASWQEVHLTPPATVGAAIYPVYDLPVFQDSKRGFLAVGYPATDLAPGRLVIYSTADAGVTWTPTRVLAENNGVGAGVTAPTSIVDSTLFVLSRCGTGGATVASVPLGGAVSFAGYACAAFVDGISFANTNDGWLFREGRLLSTTDGAASWTDITPYGQPGFPARATFACHEAGRSGYARVKARGNDVMSARNTLIEIRFGSHEGPPEPASPAQRAREDWWRPGTTAQGKNVACFNVG